MDFGVDERKFWEKVGIRVGGSKKVIGYGEGDEKVFCSYGKVGDWGGKVFGWEIGKGERSFEKYKMEKVKL